MRNLLLPPDWQACPQPTTWSCQKWFTKLLWKSMRRELRLLLLLVLSWCSALQCSLRDSMQTILSFSLSDITPQWAFCLLAGIVLPSDDNPWRLAFAEVLYTLYWNNINLILRVIKKRKISSQCLSRTLNSCPHASVTLLCAFFTISLLHYWHFALIIRTELSSFIYLVSFCQLSRSFCGLSNLTSRICNNH